MNATPNILFILTDQHAPGVAGFAGDPLVRTPHLDDLASRSVQFDTASCASPACTPSRMCLLTAMEPQRCAAWANHWITFPERVTWPGHFAEHGYATCLVGKMHFGGKDQWMTALGNCWTPSRKTACWKIPSSSTAATTGRWAGLTGCGKRVSTMKKPRAFPCSSRARGFSRATLACPRWFP